jgi:hypothetical protein
MTMPGSVPRKRGFGALGGPITFPALEHVPVGPTAGLLPIPSSASERPC